MVTCEHVTCNQTTNYDLIKCEDQATHRITWPSDGSSIIACEEHTKGYKTILAEMESRYAVKVWPEIDRLM